MASQNVETNTSAYLDEDGVRELLRLIKGHYISKRQYNESIYVEEDPITHRAALVINKLEVK